MANKALKSKCCNAGVSWGGIPDFIRSHVVATRHYNCNKCGKPCDLADTKIQKRKLSTLNKQIKASEKRIDFQGEVLQKLVELLDGITISPTKGVILTPKKKRQLAKLRKMEQKLFKSKTKRPRR